MSIRITARIAAVGKTRDKNRIDRDNPAETITMSFKSPAPMVPMEKKKYKTEKIIITVRKFVAENDFDSI
jgi:hypothetical protein